MEISELIQGTGVRPEWMLIAAVVTAALNCFFGYRLIRFWVSLTGFLAGGLIGYMALNQYVNNIGYAILAGFLLGILISFMAWRFYLAGVFFMVFIMIFSLFLRILPEETLYQILVLIVGIIASLAGAVLSVKLVRPAVIVTSAVSGGLSAAADLFVLLEKQDIRWAAAVGLLMAAAGVVIQFLTTKDRKKG